MLLRLLENGAAAGSQLGEDAIPAALMLHGIMCRDQPATTRGQRMARPTSSTPRSSRRSRTPTRGRRAPAREDAIYARPAGAAPQARR